MRHTLGAAAFFLAMLAGITLFHGLFDRSYALGSADLTLHFDPPHHHYQRIILDSFSRYDEALALSRIDVEYALREMRCREVDPASATPYLFDVWFEKVIDGWVCERGHHQPHFLLVFALTKSGQWISTIQPILDLRYSRTMTIHLPPPDQPLPTH